MDKSGLTSGLMPRYSSSLCMTEIRSVSWQIYSDSALVSQSVMQMPNLASISPLESPVFFACQILEAGFVFVRIGRQQTLYRKQD